MEWKLGRWELDLEEVIDRFERELQISVTTADYKGEVTEDLLKKIERRLKDSESMKGIDWKLSVTAGHSVLIVLEIFQSPWTNICYVGVPDGNAEFSNHVVSSLLPKAGEVVEIRGQKYEVTCIIPRFRVDVRRIKQEEELTPSSETGGES